MKKPTRLMVTAALACVICAAYAKDYKPVNQQQAERFAEDLQQAIWSINRDLPDRTKYPQRGRAFTALTKKADTTFGDTRHPQFGACVKASNSASYLWQALVSEQMSGRPTEPSKAASNAEWAARMGAELFQCQQAVAALTPPVPKECLRVLDATKGASESEPLPALPAHCPGARP